MRGTRIARTDIYLLIQFGALSSRSHRLPHTVPRARTCAPGALRTFLTSMEKPASFELCAAHLAEYERGLPALGFENEVDLREALPQDLRKVGMLSKQRTRYTAVFLSNDGCGGNSGGAVGRGMGGDEPDGGSEGYRNAGGDDSAGSGDEGGVKSSSGEASDADEKEGDAAGEDFRPYILGARRQGEWGR